MHVCAHAHTRALLRHFSHVSRTAPPLRSVCFYNSSHTPRWTTHRCYRPRNDRLFANIASMDAVALTHTHADTHAHTHESTHAAAHTQHDADAPQGVPEGTGTLTAAAAVPVAHMSAWIGPPRRPKLHGREFYESLGAPVTVCAPMVDQSELPFRMLVRRYGCQLAYTPMINARIVAGNPEAMRRAFSTAPEDRPLVAQFCGDDPEAMVTAARMIQDAVDAVDINFGCPQGIARRGHYGAFLLEEPELVVRLVRAMHERVDVPVTCKIRVLSTYEATRKLVLSIQAAGCSILTIHGRTRKNMKAAITAVDWDIIRRLRSDPEIRIPIFANGGIACHEDVAACMRATGCEGVMVSEALLENPALFKHSYTQVSSDTVGTSGNPPTTFQLAREYVQLARQYGNDASSIRAHLMRILYSAVSVHTDLRDKITAPLEAPWVDCDAVIDELESRWTAARGQRDESLEGCTSEEKLRADLLKEWHERRATQPTVGLAPPSSLADYAIPGRWYMRHRKDAFEGLCTTQANPSCIVVADGATEGAAATPSIPRELTLAERLQLYKASKRAQEEPAREQGDADPSPSACGDMPCLAGFVIDDEI